MRIPPDQEPEVFQTHRARTVLIGCASVALAVFVGMIAGVFVGGWIGQRVGVQSSGPVILGAFWGAILGGIGGALIGIAAARRGHPPDVGTRVLAAVWMGLWVLMSTFLAIPLLGESCSEEPCYQYAGVAVGVLVLLEVLVLVLALGASLIPRSASPRWFALGTGAVAAPALFLAAVGVAPVRPVTEEPPPRENVLGEVDIRFVAANAQATLPGRLTKLQLGIQPPDSEVIEVHDITGSDGAFRLVLSPGTHRFALLSVKARVLGKKAVDLFVAGPSFDVPANGCVYLGRIVFSFVRLPPGGTQTQYEALIEYIERSGGDPTQVVELIPVPGGRVYSDVPVVDLPPPDARTPGWEACTIERAMM